MTNKIQITTLTPIHIGSGVMLSLNNDYTIDNKQIGIINPNRIIDLIGMKNIDKWSEAIANKDDISEYMHKFAPLANLSDYSQRIIQKRCAGHITEIKEYIHDGNCSPYIPGSSLKGAIRTALFAIWAENHYPEHAIQTLNNGRFPCKELSAACFGKDPKVDVLKYLHIGDCYFNKNSTVALRMGNLNLRENHPQALDMSKKQCIEVLKENISAEFNIKLVAPSTQYEPQRPMELTSIETLFKSINKHTKKLVDKEFDFWYELDEYENDDSVNQYLNDLNEIIDHINDCSASECIIRLGHGSGWTFMTGGWVEEKMSENAYESVIDKARPGNRNRYSEYPFPKSRRVEENDTTPLGFIKLKIIS